MLGTASKYLALSSLFLIVAATVYGIGTGGDDTGNVALLGTSILGMTGVLAGFLAFVMMEGGDSATDPRDRDSSRDVTPAYWPVLGAVGGGIMIIGLVYSSVMTVVGVGLVGVGALEWTISAWQDHQPAE